MELYLSTFSRFSWQSLLDFRLCLYITCLSTAKETFIALNEMNVVGRDSAVGITTRYGLDGPGIKSR